MKNLLVTMTLAVAVALPMTLVPVEADPWYLVNDSNGVELRSEPYGNGRIRCTVPSGYAVKRFTGENWSRWIYVKWTNHPASSHSGINLEWEWIGATGNWCAVWDRRGWADKQQLTGIQGQ